MRSAEDWGQMMATTVSYKHTVEEIQQEARAEGFRLALKTAADDLEESSKHLTDPNVALAVNLFAVKIRSLPIPDQLRKPEGT